MKLRTTTGYTDMATEALCNTLKQELTLFTDVEAKQHGLEGKPQHLPEWKAIFLNKVESTLQGGIDKNAQLLPVSGVVVAQKGESEATDAIQPLEASLKDGELNLRQLEEQKKECTPDLRKRMVRKGGYIFTGLVAITDACLNFQTIRRIPLSLIPAIIAAATLAACIMLTTKVIAGFLYKAKSRLQFITRFCISAIPVFIGFYILGYYRFRSNVTTASLNLDPHQTPPADTGMSGLGIACISFLLFISALLFLVKYYRSKEEKEKERCYDKACRELKEQQDKMNGIQENINTIKQNAREESAQALARYEYALTIEQRLKNLSKQIINDYIIKNLKFRKDSTTPEFFSNPPELTFRTFFDNVKTNQS
jgi:flagellar biosynthesis chaperone FliJ